MAEIECTVQILEAGIDFKEDLGCTVLSIRSIGFSFYQPQIGSQNTSSNADMSTAGLQSSSTRAGINRKYR